MKKGLLITFEGNEGSGKSVQVTLLAQKLEKKGYPVVVTREPGGTVIGEQIRAITHNRQNISLLPTTEAYLMAASRAQNVGELIKPALEKGKIVLCDRFLDSSLAYQGYGRGLGEAVVAKLNQLAVGSLKPDLTFWFKVPLKVSLQRRQKSQKIDRLDLEQKSFYQKVNFGYQQIAKKNKKRIIIIDGQKSIKVIAKIIWQKVRKYVEKS